MQCNAHICHQRPISKSRARIFCCWSGAHLRWPGELDRGETPIFRLPIQLAVHWSMATCHNQELRLTSFVRKALHHHFPFLMLPRRSHAHCSSGKHWVRQECASIQQRYREIQDRPIIGVELSMELLFLSQIRGVPLDDVTQFNEYEKFYGEAQGHSSLRLHLSTVSCPLSEFCSRSPYQRTDFASRR